MNNGGNTTPKKEHNNTLAYEKGETWAVAVYWVKLPSAGPAFHVGASSSPG